MVSVIILAKNEEKMILKCINSVKEIASEIIIIDNGSTDKTVEIAKNNNCRVLLSADSSFSNLRNIGLQNATFDWVLYIDADERVSPELTKEIIEVTQSSSNISGYILERTDYYFGRQRPVSSPMHRLFKKDKLQKWNGELHETPQVEGSIGKLKNPLIHLTHTDIDSMLVNTSKWSKKEAQLRFDINHPPIVWWRLLRVMFTAFYGSFVKQKGYKCGTEGWVEALYQSTSIYLTYARLWELQNKAEISKRYQDIENKL
ncbi:MAG: glycosyltransferase family 2 protein [bacterium]|nr:glycosyltransferase family 2 protein [bacterium]